MHIGILEPGVTPDDLLDAHGTMPEMATRLFGTLDPSLRFSTWRVVDGVFPDSVTATDGWLVMGSKHGVYEDLPWMRTLKDFLRRKVYWLGNKLGNGSVELSDSFDLDYLAATPEKLLDVARQLERVAGGVGGDDIVVLGELRVQDLHGQLAVVYHQNLRPPGHGRHGNASCPEPLPPSSA